jgi:hypothetical protein
MNNCIDGNLRRIGPNERRQPHWLLRFPADLLQIGRYLFSIDKGDVRSSSDIEVKVFRKTTPHILLIEGDVMVELDSSSLRGVVLPYAELGDH